MTTQTDIAINPDRLNALLGQAVVEFGATVNAALVVIGDRLGLYRALAAEGPANAAELAQQTGTAKRYVREWLGAQAASGYVDYDADTDSYALSPEQAAAFADESSPAFVAGGFQVALGATADLERIQDAFLTGEGMGWHEHGNDVFEGCRRFFEPGYRANLSRSCQCRQPLLVLDRTGSLRLAAASATNQHRTSPRVGSVPKVEFVEEALADRDPQLSS